MRSLVVLADRLFDGTHFVERPCRILVEHGRIVRVEPGAAGRAPRDAVDARGRLVMPGLINAHVHIARGGMFEAGEPPLPLQVLASFRDGLRAGVTTVADMGCPAPLAAALRGATAAEPLAGPSLVAAGPLLTAPGGYPFDWMPPLVAKLGAALACGSEREAGAAVERVASAGMDHVKLAVMHQSYANQPLPTVSVEVARAVVHAAHGAGLKVFAHAHSNADYRVALDAGADALMHSSFEPLDAELVERIRASGIAVCPTLWVFESACALDGCELARDPRFTRHLTRSVRRSLRRFAEAYRASGDVVPPGIAGGLDKAFAREAVRVAAANLALLADAGVPIVFGNDAAYGFSLIARPVDELGAMQRAALDARACLRAATRSAAELLGLSDRGVIAPGKRADLIVVDREVEHDVGAVERVSEVIVAGRRLQPDAPSRVSAAARIGLAYARGALRTAALAAGLARAAF